MLQGAGEGEGRGQERGRVAWGGRWGAYRGQLAWLGWPGSSMLQLWSNALCIPRCCLCPQVLSLWSVAAGAGPKGAAPPSAPEPVSESNDGSSSEQEEGGEKAAEGMAGTAGACQHTGTEMGVHGSMGTEIGVHWHVRGWG